MPTPTNIPTRQSAKWAWIWFAYTGFLFITPFFEPTVLRWSVTIGAFAIFAGVYALYIRGVEDQTSLRFWMIATTFLLGLIVFPINQGASCFFIYAAALLPFNVVSLRRVTTLFLGEITAVLIEGSIFHTFSGLLHVSWANTFIAIFLMGMIGGINIFFAQQKRAECQLRSALEENLALAAVAERERIARDLHDVLGHTLSVIVLKAELASRLLTSTIPTPDPVRAATEIADVERIARTALSEVREAIGGYRARGLAAEIESARLTLDAAGVTLVAESNPSATAALSATEETALALALREAVTNIVRHARATTCNLRFISEHGTRRLIVEDNGRNPVAREGNGLRGMRQRIESIGGQLRLESDNGTRLSIDLPLRTERANA
jgi:two-component system sensor histidine kinase DesK